MEIKPKSNRKKKKLWNLEVSLLLYLITCMYHDQ